MKKVGVTGFTGFIGKRLLSYPKLHFDAVPIPLRNVKADDLDLGGMDAIIHLAGKAHDLGNTHSPEYFYVNADLTMQMAVAAKKQGVAHFIYFSSVKVYGDGSVEYFNETSSCKPDDLYGESKYKAELILSEMASPGFKVAIVRPPLVYGPEVKANMLNLVKLAHINFPLPFGNTENRRSMVFLDNLVELVNVIIDREAGGIFIAGDKEPLSIGQWVSLIRKQLGMKPALFDAPVFMKTVLKKIKPSLYKRLFESYVIDNTATNKLLSFSPPYSSEEGIRELIQWYLKKSQ